ncbi:Putative transcriptional regulator yvhJ [Slackia heliotrinireducens]|uniref:Cell envelope-related function transcriptional attenuator common domain protein n=1 Tax=Slackia heliotrinireducens (strain ATCC 29202 / DSM 20476 / NCTC 11029 / RHS 1) TaxID=471855 RepID=C7N6K1_SLAHD|nr:LCP family protein [Slackia heliotrinireducens]ACV22536.1 cell envelope-related function transcriptional attenuator common domain protein [Slackia heliotrinireducens DSM 20476]VEH00987.1 Putative transcriptional regulator yvhJ [Slackia heliotrinireducens]
MPIKRRPPSSSQINRTSQQVRNASVTNRITTNRITSTSKRRQISNTRKTRAVRQGEISHVLPDSSSRESRREYESRMARPQYFERESINRRKQSMHALIPIILGALLVAAIIFGFVYLKVLDSRVMYNDDALDAVLAEPASGEPYYLLLAGDFAKDGEASETDAVVLVRIDEAANRADVIGIPSNTRISVSDGSNVLLKDVISSSGPAEMVYGLQNLLGIDIAHVMTTDADGFVELVDMLDGVTVVVEDNVVDQDAGDIILSPGRQHLTGEEALYLCRANDYASTDNVRERMVSAVAIGLYHDACNLGTLKYAVSMDRMSKLFKSDMGTREMRSLLKDLKDLRKGELYAASIQTYTASEEGSMYETVDLDNWAEMLERIDAGEEPQVDPLAAIKAVDPASFTVTVNNGGEVVGAATQAGEILTDQGFKVESIGNANMAVYDETLVVYQDMDLADSAEAVVTTLGIGRAIYDPVYYAFNTDVLVVVGNDWDVDSRTIAEAEAAKAISGEGSGDVDAVQDETTQTQETQE